MNQIQHLLANTMCKMLLKNLNRTLVLTTIIFLISLTVGCDTLRFAPSQTQKQNAYLHHHTVQSAALQAKLDNASQPVQDLTNQATYQSEAILAYYGMPSELPSTNSVTDLLSENSQSITSQAAADAIERPNPWEVTDQLLELGIALAGVIGGVYGSKALAALRIAKDKSTALREVVTGNELFKQRNSAIAEEFKQSQQHQSATTRGIVANLKHGN